MVIENFVAGVLELLVDALDNILEAALVPVLDDVCEWLWSPPQAVNTKLANTENEIRKIFFMVSTLLHSDSNACHWV